MGEQKYSAIRLMENLKLKKILENIIQIIFAQVHQ